MAKKKKKKPGKRVKKSGKKKAGKSRKRKAKASASRRKIRKKAKTIRKKSKQPKKPKRVNIPGKISKIDSLLNQLKDSNRILVVEKVGNIDPKIHNAIKHFLKSGIPGMFISLSRPYNAVVKHLKKEKISIDKMFVVDTVSDIPEKKRESHVYYTGSPQELTDLGIIISQFLGSIKKEKFIVIGALDVLLVYNDINTVSKFIISVTSKTSESAKAVFFISDEARELLRTIYPFFDTVIEGGKIV